MVAQRMLITHCFRILTSWEKLDILYNLCEMRMENSDMNGIIKVIVEHLLLQNVML